MILFLAQLLTELGHEIVIGCSGYGSPMQHNAQLAPEGDLDANTWGDEPALVRSALASVPIIVGRDRVLAAQLARDAYPSSILLMDDGFQHLRLWQPLSIILDPDRRNKFCLPAGPYREPRTLGRKRSTLVLPNPEYSIEASELEFFDQMGQQVDAPANCYVLCAIAQPNRLIEALKNKSVDIMQAVFEPDHNDLLAGNLLDRFEKGETIVVTTKDWVKLKKRSDLKEWTFVICSYSVTIEPQDEFTKWLKHKIDEFDSKMVAG